MNKVATLIFCGIVGAAGMGAASAATQEFDAPSLVVKYDRHSLQTDTGAHAVYRKIVFAAEQVCPQSSESRLVSEGTQQCRAKAIARAVTKINDSRLAAIYVSSSRSG
jgi:UrcA family protein